MPPRKSSIATEVIERVPLRVPVPPAFDLGLAVSSYGFFMLPPNQWFKAGSPDSHSKAGFRRPLRLASGDAVTVKITQETVNAVAGLHVAVEPSQNISEADRSCITAQVVRMLRLRPGDIEQVAAFQSMHEEARQENFGYMFRSPSLWEDMIKSITLCNCGWGRTISMNAALCSKVGAGAFPSPRQVLEAGPEALQSRCGVGYRAKTMCSLAQQVLDGKVSELEAQSDSLSAAELYKRVLPFSGMGPFTAANVLQLLGHFERIAADSETLRHLKQFHKPPGLTPKNVQEVAQKVYERYHPYQYLAYWYEMRRTYEDLFGCLTEMDPQDYARATGHVMRACAAGTVRPLGSNEPLLASAAAGDSPTQGQELSAEAAADLAEGTLSAGVPCQALTGSGRPRRKRKAARAAIDAALQTLADVQADTLASSKDGESSKLQGRAAAREQASLKQAVQDKLEEASAAQPTPGEREQCRSMATRSSARTGCSAQPADADVAAAPVTPDGRPRTRRARTAGM